MKGELRGCGDHSCAVERPQSLGTNGGCRCPCWKLRAKIARLTRELAEARELIREMTGTEPVFADPRVRYVEVQIDRETWEAARALTAAPSPEPTP